MSYDISLVIDTGGEQPAEVEDVGNMTSNVSRMWTLALGYPLARLHNKRASECIAALERAVESMRAPSNRARYEAMNPPDGWGDHDSAATYLETLLAACRRHPNTTVRIYR